MGIVRFSKVVIIFSVVLLTIQFLLSIWYVNENQAVRFEVLQDAIAIPNKSTERVQSFADSLHSRDTVNPVERQSSPEMESRDDRTARRVHTKSMIHVSAVVCGERTAEATTMLKSSTLFTNRTIQLHVVAEDYLHANLKNIFSSWSNVVSGQVRFKLYSLHFPPGEDAGMWKKLFKPCASQRLFLLDILRDVDSVLYMDTDVLMLRPVEDIWNHFNAFNGSQLASMSPESEEAALAWYPRFAQHPFYGQNGMNSGVMLMNLTRMRNFGWTEKVLEIYYQYKLKITWGDQDILNILFHDHPDQIYTYSCDWNFRPDHCIYGSNCAAAKNNGISIIHGNRGVYHNEKQAFFKAVYTAMRDFMPGSDLKLLASHLAENLQSASSGYCASMVDHVMKYPNLMSKRR